MTQWKPTFIVYFRPSFPWDPKAEKNGSILDTTANIQEQDPGSWHKTNNKNKKKGHNSEVQFLCVKATMQNKKSIVIKFHRH
jgi:hypothetical protein